MTLLPDRLTLESCLQFCLWPWSARGPLDPADYFAFSVAVDGTYCHHHPALCCIQTLWDCTLQVEAWPVLGHPVLLAHPYVAQLCLFRSLMLPLQQQNLCPVRNPQ